MRSSCLPEVLFHAGKSNFRILIFSRTSEYAGNPSSVAQRRYAAARNRTVSCVRFSIASTFHTLRAMPEKSFLVQKFAKLGFGPLHVIGYSVAGEETVV